MDLFLQEENQRQLFRKIRMGEYEVSPSAIFFFPSKDCRIIQNVLAPLILPLLLHFYGCLSQFFQEDWVDISEPAKDLISKLLVVDPSRRIKAQAALQHEWICKVDDEDLSARSLSSSLDSLRSSLKSIQTEEGYTAEWLIEGREMIE